jgi:hypothetical protein
MADHMAAEIWIGGKLRRSLLEEMPIDDLTIDWDCTSVIRTPEEELLKGCDENGYLHFCDPEIAWGEFQDLEEWLREHKVPFRRHSSGKYEYLPETAEFRPDLKEKRQQYDEYVVSDEGTRYIAAEPLRKVANRMRKLVVTPSQRLHSTPTKRLMLLRLRAWEKRYYELERNLPPELPPLPKFEIVDG